MGNKKDVEPRRRQLQSLPMPSEAPVTTEGVVRMEFVQPEQSMNLPRHLCLHHGRWCWVQQHPSLESHHLACDNDPACLADNFYRIFSQWSLFKLSDVACLILVPASRMGASSFLCTPISNSSSGSRNHLSTTLSALLNTNTVRSVPRPVLRGPWTHLQRSTDYLPQPQGVSSIAAITLLSSPFLMNALQMPWHCKHFSMFHDKTL